MSARTTSCLRYPERYRLYRARMDFEWATRCGTPEQFRKALAKYLAAREVA